MDPYTYWWLVGKGQDDFCRLHAANALEITHSSKLKTARSRHRPVIAPAREDP